MKIITFNIPDSNELTIKGSILEQIKIFKEKQVKAKEQIKARVKELNTLKAEVKAYLNGSLGEDIWFDEKRNEGSYFLNGYKEGSTSTIKAAMVQLSFRDGVYKNTSYNDWELCFQSPKNPRFTLGKLEYDTIQLDKIEMFLVGSSQNKGKVHKINDVSEIANYLETDYLTYFTRKDK